MSTKPPVHAAIYARISEDHQEGAGVERQVQACKELAAQASYGFAISEANIYVDNSISAYSGKKRPAFEKLLGAMAAGTVQAVLAWAPDRICRDMWDELDFREKAKRAGVRLIYVQGGELNQEDPNKVLMSNVFASVNQWESDIKSARVAAAAKQRALAGRPPGGIRKFGYSPDHMELDPKEAPALKEAVEAVLAGASVRSQAAMLNARGLVTPSRIDPANG